MKHRSEGATALLGMPGFVVGAQLEVDGEIWLHVETTAEVVGCSSCGTRAVGHGRRRVKVRDLAIAGRDVVLVWAKRLWRCPDADCEVGTWSERCDVIAPGRRSPNGPEPRSAVGWAPRRTQWPRPPGTSAWAGTPPWKRCATTASPWSRIPLAWTGVEALGLDETVMLHGGPRRHTTYVTGFVDLDRGRLLDIALGRSGSVVETWLAERDEDWRADIDVVALDPFRGYANGLLAQLGHATVVLDHFHAIRLANAAVDDVRRRVQQEVLGHRGRKGDPLYGIRRLLLVGAERLGERGRVRIAAGLAAGDRFDEVGAAWTAKELRRAVYAAADTLAARRALGAFYQWCTEVQVPEVSRLAKTVSAWEHEVLAYHTTGLSNGPTEAVNLLIEKVRRIGHGFRNFENYRLRLLLRCGVTWQTRPAARIRGRQPRLVA